MPSPLAVGELDCSNAWSEGVFTHGVYVDSTNKIMIPVEVTQAGAWSVNSAPLNGTTFSGSGMLQAGRQVIVLKGNGKPVKAGAFLMSVDLGASDCGLYVTFQ